MFLLKTNWYILQRTNQEKMKHIYKSDYNYFSKEILFHHEQ